MARTKAEQIQAMTGATTKKSRKLKTPKHRSQLKIEKEAKKSLSSDKKRRFHPGTRAKWEVKKYQKWFPTGKYAKLNMIEKSVFQRIIDEELQEASAALGIDITRMQADARKLLHYESELVINEIFSKAKSLHSTMESKRSDVSDKMVWSVIPYVLPNINMKRLASVIEEFVKTKKTTTASVIEEFVKAKKTTTEMVGHMPNEITQDDSATDIE